MSFGKAWGVILKQENQKRKKMATESEKYLKQIEGLMRGHTGASKGNIDIPSVRRKKKVDAGTPKPVETKVLTSKVHENTLKKLNKKFAKDMKKMGVGYSGTTDYEV